MSCGFASQLSIVPHQSPPIPTWPRSSLMTCANGPRTASAATRRPRSSGPARVAWRRAKGRWSGIRPPAAVRSLDGDAQPLAGGAECLVDLMVRGGFGEEEAQVLVTFRERLDDLAQRDGDRKARDPPDGCGVGPAVHGPEPARGGGAPGGPEGV